MLEKKRGRLCIRFSLIMTRTAIYPLFIGSCGYYKNEIGTWSAWDNMTGDCWCEDFKTRKEAVAYVEEYH